MRIAVVGPTHPYKGGVAAHTTRTAHALAAAQARDLGVAHAHGLPVLATRVGTFPAQVTDGVDGVLVEPGDAAALSAALRRLADPAELARLEDGLPAVDLRGPWVAYAAALTATSGPDDGLGCATFRPRSVRSTS